MNHGCSEHVAGSASEVRCLDKWLARERLLGEILTGPRPEEEAGNGFDCGSRGRIAGCAPEASLIDAQRP